MSRGRSRGKREREREREADSPLSRELIRGSIPGPRDPDLS